MSDGLYCAIQYAVTKEIQIKNNNAVIKVVIMKQ